MWMYALVHTRALVHSFTYTDIHTNTLTHTYKKNCVRTHSHIHQNNDLSTFTNTESKWIRTPRMLIFGKLQRLFHSLRMYSLSPTMTTCLSSSSSKLLARSGIIKFHRPIRAEWASAKRQTTTWLDRTVIAACSRVCSTNSLFIIFDR